ncbi:MAG: VOC family protein [Sciscionella sp.]|nr:VOC family protein [Sciscionella sp.]
MSTQLSPYLHFRDNARQAMEFYQSVLGGDLTVNTFADFHASDDPAEADKTMHAQLETKSGLQLMASDTPKAMEYQQGTNFSLSLSGDDEPTLRGYWEKLSAGGTVAMPLDKAPWGDIFGMCVDKFGVHWMVNISSEQQAS